MKENKIKMMREKITDINKVREGKDELITVNTDKSQKRSNRNNKRHSRLDFLF